MQHLDEGAIHAWLDGQLPANKAAEVTGHASECAECAAMVAEARGLVVASTRILTALDNVPAGVTPVPSEGLSVPIVQRRWYDRTDIRVAAALLFVAGTSLVVVRGGRESTSSRAMMTIGDKAEATAPVALDSVSLQSSGAEISQLNAPAIERRGLESRTRANALNKSAAASAPAVMQAEALAAPAVTTGTAFAKKSIGSVEGRVTDQDSGKGLHGATVDILGTPVGATTDTAGRFKIENVPAGAQRVAVRRIGYVAQSIPLVVDSGITATAQVALAASPTSLDEVVVTSMAAKVDVVAASLHVLRTDNPAGTKRTVYQVSPGVEVTLTESPADTGVTRDFVSRGMRANEAASQRSAGAEKEKDIRTIPGGVAGVAGGRISQAVAVADTASVPLNTISWADHGRRYTLSGRLTTKDLEVLKARLMAMRR